LLGIAMADGPTIRLEGWTPVALSADLLNGGVMRTTVGDRDLAIWRSRAGVVRAWNNRCPHRGMRLSFGFVRGESLTCIYHGWQYGTDGACHNIPAHPDLKPPDTLCVEAFSCIEKSGLVWVSLSEAETEPEIGVDDLEPVRSLTVDRDLADVNAMLAESRFPITEAWRPEDGDFQTMGDAQNLIIREGRAGGDRRSLITALQPLPDNRMTAHVLTSPKAPPGLKIALSRWLERLRWFAENPAVETNSWHPHSARAGG
jgi:nitrite reductase/ring-hydroxylating ferredoxin subunit